MLFVVVVVVVTRPSHTTESVATTRRSLALPFSQVFPRHSCVALSCVCVCALSGAEPPAPLLRFCQIVFGVRPWRSCWNSSVGRSWRFLGRARELSPLVDRRRPCWIPLVIVQSVGVDCGVEAWMKPGEEWLGWGKGTAVCVGIWSRPARGNLWRHRAYQRVASACVVLLPDAGCFVVKLWEEAYRKLHQNRRKRYYSPPIGLCEWRFDYENTWSSFDSNQMMLVCKFHRVHPLNEQLPPLELGNLWNSNGNLFLLLFLLRHILSFALFIFWTIFDFFGVL